MAVEGGIQPGKVQIKTEGKDDISSCSTCLAQNYQSERVPVDPENLVPKLFRLRLLRHNSNIATSFAQCEACLIRLRSAIDEALFAYADQTDGEAPSDV